MAVTFVCVIAFIYPNNSVFAAPAKADETGVVIYAYQRIGDDMLPHASLSLEQFTAQMTELQKDNYAVLPLSAVVDAYKAGTPLPAKAVALTFDGAYVSTLERVAPILDAANYPYTVFFNSDAIDRRENGSLDWDGLRALARKKNVELGMLPAHYTHMVAADMAANAASINKAVARFREEIGTDARYFAWPYGEYSQALKNKLAEYNFDAAFGSSAGVAYAGADRLSLPRFSMNDLTGDFDRFRQTARALPFPVSDVSPDDPVLRDNPPMIGFTVASDVGPLGGIACFVSGQGKVEARKVAGNRIELRPERSFADRRTRVNCTLPDTNILPGEEARWRWLGFLFVDPEFDEASPIADTSGFE